MYLRFVVDEKHERSQKRLGILHAIRYLRDDGELSDDEIGQTDKLMEWFATHLRTPDVFTRKSKSRAISWFKDNAEEHIAKCRAIAAVLKAHGQNVEMIRTEKPGYILHEDEYQIIAEPFSDTKT
jgi:hypothetical protein